MNDIMDGLWYVNESGYEVTNAQEEKSGDLFMGKGLDISFVGDTDDFFEVRAIETTAHISPIDHTSPMNSYSLMNYPGLFMEFASLGEPEPTINFANKHGLLKRPHDQSEPVFSLWLRNIRRMRLYIGIIARIREGSSNDDIKEFVINDGFEKLPIGTPPFIRDIIEKNGVFFVDRVIKVLLDEDENVVKAEYQLRQIPKSGIKNPTNLREAFYHYVSLSINYHLENCLVFRTNVNDWNTGVDISLQPKDLLSALWLQLSYFVSKNLEFKKCAECTNYFEVKAKKRKNEKIYCSDRCRVRVAARERRAKEKAAKEKAK